MRFSSKIILFPLLWVVFSSTSIFSQDAGNLDSLQRQTPSGQYIDPASFFRLHGYVSLTFAQPGKDFGGQILVNGVHPVSKENAGGFKNDAALFVGGEPLDGIGSVMELHFVGNAMNPVITEAKIIVHVVDAEDGGNYNLRIIAGRYWWPFGIHNDEWFSAVNRYNLVSPAALQVVPPHYNEIGLATEGEILFSPTFGANYVLSIGNGVSSFEMADVIGSLANTYDYNESRTVTARTGFIYKNKNTKAEIGVSIAQGELRQDSLGTGSAREYASEFSAFGVDFRANVNNFGIRSYYYMSTETLDNAPINEFIRNGATIEPFFDWNTSTHWLKRIQFHARYGFAEEETFTGTNKWLQSGAGINFHFKGKLTVR